MAQRVEVAVVGLGAVGAATLHALARRGLPCAGWDQFSVGHGRGSSHGETRAIRTAYFEHPDYVPLVQRAFRLWRELHAASPEALLHDRIGAVLAGPPGGAVVGPTLVAARQHGLDIAPVTPGEAKTRWPDLCVPDGLEILFEAEAGALRPEACCRALVEAGVESGATAVEGTAVERIEPEDAGGFTLLTSDGRVRAERVAVGAGPWAAEILAGLGLPLERRRKVSGWHAPRRPGTHGRDRLPIFLVEGDGSIVYGFPDLDGNGVKVADHLAGAAIDGPEPDRDLAPGDLATVEDMVRRCLPGLEPTATRHSVCTYTMTPDGQFIVDRHPEWPGLSYAAGLSGHGFKFAPVLGEALADLALEGGSPLPIEFLSARRFG